MAEREETQLVDAVAEIIGSEYRKAIDERRTRTVYRDVAEEVVRFVADKTPLHAFVKTAREKGLAIDISVYGPDAHALGEDTKSTYVSGVRITGHKGDPMDVIRAGLRAMEDQDG